MGNIITFLFLCLSTIFPVDSLHTFMKGGSAIDYNSEKVTFSQVFAESFQNLKTFSIFDSSKVRFVGNWPFGPSYSVCFDSIRNFVFLSSGGGVYVLDISDFSNIHKVSEKIHTRNIVYDIFYESSTQRLYIASGIGGVEIWDVSDPLFPWKLGKCLIYASELYVSGNYAYVVKKDSGVYVIDISDPYSPFEISFYITPGSASGIYVSGNYAYVADGDSGLRIIDISDPYSPFEVGFYDTPGYARDVYVL